MITKNFHKAALMLVLSTGIAACASNETKAPETTQSQKAEMSSENVVSALYEVHHDNRIYVFYDEALYKSFVKMGHTPYMFTEIGAGPKGETLVYALTGKDKKKRSGIPSVELLAGKAKAAEDFYGEMRAEGRIFVFNNVKDMEMTRKTGEAALRYTEIGAGPKGETVIYVLNSTNKKKKPVALIEAFKQRNS